MGNNSMCCCKVVVVLSLFLFLGCSSGPKEEMQPIGELKEGDLQFETYIVDGEEFTSINKVYNLAEASEDPVFVILPLDSGDSIVNEIEKFMDQTSTSGSEIKAYSDKYYISVYDFINLAKGVNSESRSKIFNTSMYDNLDELDELLNQFQQTFGEYEISTLIIILDEMGLSLK